MSAAENIERLVKKFYAVKKSSIATNAEMDTKVLDDALQALDKSKKIQSAATQPNIWRIIMKGKITKLAVAAVIIIACLIGLSLWPGTGTGIALAEVLARIEQVKAYRCQMSTTVNDKPISQATILMSQTFGMKTNIEIDHPITGQSILQQIYVLPPKRTITTVMPNEKKYSQLEFDEASFEGWQQEYDPGYMVRRILECEHTSLGKSTIDGTEVEGFQTTDPNYMRGSMDQVQVDVKIWVDVKRRLPMRLEIDCNKEDKMNMHAVVYDFQWDIPVDAAEFEPVIPDDYTPGQPMLQILPGRNRQ